MPRRILIVDDDSEFCAEIAEILRDEGYFVDIAADGLQGASRINAGSYDVVLLDFKMPGLDGVELLKKIKAKNKDSKVFLVSGRPFLEKITNELAPSQLADAVFSKPFDVGLLLSKIRALS